MISNDSDDFLDLDRSLKVTPQDVAALRRVREMRPLSIEEYAAFLASLPQPTCEQLRSRKGPCGEPFHLDF
jgi:hypothetical protein